MKELYVVAAIGLATPLNLPVFRAGLEAQLARNPYFRSIQVTDKDGTPRWVRTTVNMDNHIVVVPRLELDETDADPDKAVEDYLSSLSTLPMDHTRPPWEFHFLDVRTSEAASIVVLRMHHALADGMSLITLLVSSSRSAADPAKPMPVPPPPARRAGAIYAPPPSTGALVWIWSYLLLAWHTLVDVAAFVATILFLRDPHTLFKRVDNGEPQRPMRFIHRSFSLDDVKFIKNAMNCMDVDMIESGKSDAVRWGNRLGYILLPFHLAMRDDPLEYVRKAKRIIDRKKSSLEMIVVHMAIDITFKIFGPKAGAYIFNNVLRNTTVTFSNLIGPPEQIELCGHPVAYIAPSVYGLQQALTVHYQSYSNTIKVILAVDEAQFPDFRQLLDDFAESLKLITKDVAAKASTKPIKND
ncbi:O-acyltransferase WSD1 [Dichanthelium oligosanthes]|uniref:O-acyltransferase WSD1 n=1 Tax=Dichanthelium oligosanthes TaxID=888268 RepID=A0A1E5UK05_9POAL|nr:O-acyltransferase WSD1 [Dichanthelium oligosanthes]